MKASRRKRGVALLMTLSALVVLSAALAKSLEDRSLAVSLSSAEDKSFKANLLARSGLRGILKGLQTAGLWNLLNSPMGLAAMKTGKEGYHYQLGLPFGGGTLHSLKVRHMDHLFELNRYTNSNNVDRAQMMSNLVGQIKDKAKSTGYWSPDMEPILSAVNDFTDKDSQIDTVFPYGNETPGNERVPYFLKNRFFDQVEELRLIPAFRELKLAPYQTAEHFRVHPRKCQNSGLSGCDSTEQLDVNYASKKLILDFISRYEGVEGYQDLVANKERLAEIFLEGRTDMGAKYTGQLDGRGGKWQKELEEAALTLSAKEKSLFTAETSLIGLELVVEYQGIYKRLSVVLQFQGTGTNLGEMHVLSYRVD